ncbi:uncharacterized protein [Magallana gigas]|uniref:uncharacterized protein n=1 Tax=Magallana gigas TaxID=29159 RepID=UPI00333F05E5
MDCNQQNTHATFLSFTMPCPVDHIDCVNSMCFCSIDKITTTTRAASTTTPLSTSHPTLTTTTSTGLMCPECDENLICSWTRDCYPGEVCMIRQFNRTLTVHCSEKDDCNFMKKFVPEILCCKDIQCINHIII